MLPKSVDFGIKEEGEEARCNAAPKKDGEFLLFFKVLGFMGFGVLMGVEINGLPGAVMPPKRAPFCCLTGVLKLRVCVVH